MRLLNIPATALKMVSAGLAVGFLAISGDAAPPPRLHMTPMMSSMRGPMRSMPHPSSHPFFHQHAFHSHPGHPHGSPRHRHHHPSGIVPHITMDQGGMRSARHGQSHHAFFMPGNLAGKQSLRHGTVRGDVSATGARETVQQRNHRLAEENRLLRHEDNRLERSRRSLRRQDNQLTRERRSLRRQDNRLAVDRQILFNEDRQLAGILRLQERQALFNALNFYTNPFNPYNSGLDPHNPFASMYSDPMSGNGGGGSSASADSQGGYGASNDNPGYATASSPTRTASYTPPANDEEDEGETDSSPRAEVHLSWPLGLRVLGPSAEAGALRQQLDGLMQTAVKQAQKGSVDTRLSQEAKRAVGRLRQMLNDKGSNLAHHTYTEAKQFLDQLDGMFK